MPTEPAFATKREVEEAKPFLVLPEGPKHIPFRVDSLFRLLNTLQYAMTLLGEECECHSIAGGPCHPCQWKAALLRVWNGGAEQQ